MAAFRQPFIIPFRFGLDGYDDLRDGTLARMKSPYPGTTQSPVAQPKLPPANSRDALFKKAASFLEATEGIPPHPYWPGGISGVTFGVGWDASQQTRAALDQDWSDLPLADRDRLATTLGKDKAGATAKALLSSVKDISIPKTVSIAVLKTSLIPKYYKKTQTAFPGVTFLPDPVQVALISLVYNRGEAMTDKKGQTGAGLDARAQSGGNLDRRYEMRRIRDDVSKQDIQGIADQLRHMERLWVGTKDAKGMLDRREKEAAMVETAIPIKGSPKGNI